MTGSAIQQCSCENEIHFPHNSSLSHRLLKEIKPSTTPQYTSGRFVKPFRDFDWFPNGMLLSTEVLPNLFLPQLNRDSIKQKHH